jgi:hypothetical protein
MKTEHYNSDFLELCERVKEHKGTQKDRKEIARILLLDGSICKTTARIFSSKNTESIIITAIAGIGTANCVIAGAEKTLSNKEEDSEPETPEHYNKYKRLLIISLCGIWLPIIAYFIWLALSK